MRSNIKEQNMKHGTGT